MYYFILHIFCQQKLANKVLLSPVMSKLVPIHFLRLKLDIYKNASASEFPSINLYRLEINQYFKIYTFM